MITHYVESLTDAFNSISKTCDEVLPSYRSEYITAVCADFNPSQWSSFASLVMGACNVPESGVSSNPLSSSQLFSTMCKHAPPPQSKDIPGGLAGSSQDESLFAFLGDHTKLITYGANSPVSLSWTSTVTEARSFQTEVSVQKTLTSEFDLDVQAVFGVGLGPYVTSTDGDKHSFTLSLGKTSDSNHVSERTVSVTLDDGDSGDYFAVRVTEDPVYATPVFTTMGGVSKCPGETGTTRRESRVRIVRIQPRCGPTKNLPCTASNLAVGDTANFAVVIENLSPSFEPVDYTLRVKPAYDDENTVSAGVNGAYVCGASAQTSNLQFTFSNTDLQRIPYKNYVEVPFSVDQGLCDSYSDIALEIIATCEMPSSSSYVYQYGVEFDATTKKTSVLYDSPIYATSDLKTATFSVAWPSSTRRLEARQPNDESYAALEVKMGRTQESLDRLVTAVCILLMLTVLGAVFAGLFTCYWLRNEKKTAVEHQGGYSERHTSTFRGIVAL
jgi:hypothetical protein